MLKIIFYINVLSNGGAERVMSVITSELAERGYECILVTTYKTDNEYHVSDSVKRVVLEKENEYHASKFKRNFLRIVKLRKICQEEKPDIVISFMTEANVRAIIATLCMKTKTIISVRTDPKRIYSSLKGRLIGKCVLPLADGCIFQTEYAKGWFPKRFQKKGRVIFNPIADKFYNKKNVPIDNLVINCARLCDVKNHRMLIHAFSKVVNEVPDAKLKIYGDGEERDALCRLIEDSGLKNNVFLEGNIENIEDILAQAKLFVLSSKYEGMPNALMEAMAVGVACISTDCESGGPRTVFGEEFRDMLIKVGDEEALAIKIKEMLSSNECAGVGKAMKERAGIFQKDYIVMQWIDYLESVAKK
jgi:glycosyltransferase involved in cell wall biosynthesis